jgi:hypothetical protein
MTRQINRAENWELAYTAFKQVNFAAFNYDSVKQALIDYIRQYHPESFNDFIEASELVATIEAFSYFAELMAYRYDMNAHENFLTVAQRKESVLRLAKYLSYSASRNIPARGLVKLVSISTSETVFDSLGNNLANVTVKWNDPLISNWRERFLLVLNRAMAREYGNVTPTDRVQISDVLFEQYQFSSANTPTVFPYSATFGGESYPMELVSTILTADGPEERRPTKQHPFAIVFADDGNGDDSPLTGFFCMTKQGTLNRKEFAFDGVTPNYSAIIDTNGINDTDVWLNNIDADGVPTIDPSTGTTNGLWDTINTSTAYNIVFNTADSKRLYEIESLDGDKVRLVFGDGEFADIPTGKFELWFRTSERERDIVVPKTAIANQLFSFTYPDTTGQLQTLRFTVSATSSLQNAASSEKIERIRRVAPATYYTQDRMVNAKDYNVYPLQDNSILKLRSTNRTFAGDSKYMYWHDPRGSYENIKLYGDDLTLYYDTIEVAETIPSTINIDGLISGTLEPLLRTADLVNRFVFETGYPTSRFRSTFTDTEVSALRRILAEAAAATPSTVYAILVPSSTTVASWSFSTTRPNDLQSGVILSWFKVKAVYDGTWEVTRVAKRLLATSTSTKFWNVNQGKTITYDTYSANYDSLTILAANTDVDGNVLTTNIPFTVRSQEIISQGTDRGLPDVSTLVVAPIDSSKDGTPDNLSIDPLFPDTTLTDDTKFIYFELDSTGAWNQVATTTAIIQDYYEQFGWSYTVSGETVTKAIAPTIASVTGFKVVWKYGPAPNATIKREIGRTNLNFLWMHFTPRYHLIDPAASNLIDMFIMTRGYFQSHELWLNDRLPQRPTPPKPVELRMSYKPLLNNKMMSDTVVFLPGKIKTIINSKSDPSARCRLKVIKSPDTLLTNSEIKVKVIEACREFFDLNKWEFGQTFYFTKLSAAVHGTLPGDIDSIVIVPDSTTGTFGDAFQVAAREDEIIYGFVTPRDIDIVESLDRRVIKQSTHG